MHPSASQIVGLYERHAEAWDRERGKALFEQSWIDRFRALVRPGGALLDIGCGSGEPIARYLIEQGHTVTGVDASPSMIEACRARFPDHAWLVADMRSLALDRRFDGLIAWDSFFHLSHDDQRGMFPVFAAHAAEGAALMFTSGPAHGEAIGSFEGEALYHASLAPDAYVALLSENGFDVVAHVVEDQTCGGHTVWLAKARGMTRKEKAAG
ncbi:class I SAM-dependent DNA methyltransferase [Hyphomicrobium sp.]|uniref:class I SAM-dependent DNA methyltransferase n=1 Tax=Hyphomicrobium sp. TaxID=82 RepID=UPI003F71BDE3